MDYIILIAGFLLLVKGADFFVEGSSSIARKVRIPTLIIGLTLVAFGTSAPEAAVSITSALQGQNDMAIGNIVGSNIFNLLLVVGIAAFISPLKVKRSIIFKEFPFALLSAFVLLILAYDTQFQDSSKNILTQADGMMLLVLFGIFMYYLIELALTSRATTKGQQIETEAEAVEGSSISNFKSIIFAIGGIVGIILGGKFVVDAATEIALGLGMSESLVGLTIVAVGTSLPELVTSIVAARRGQSDIALGNVIGSNIFNVFFVLGISAWISPIAISDTVFFDMLFLLGISIVAYLFAITKKSIDKFEGIFLASTYIAYLTFIIIRN
ncbi:calcium/sodium antiporter [Cellulosilyticum sp. I15G10I2]|uniref:calcium/sodium antiporter n=1 Tax=Cellulosilyticum sp. I15G10I2 TaxID=1892843 RepID=UPI00085CD713|nr:calcium/sodium antiporter [Cellulosilyticum sp. I15G10I2]